MLELLLGLCERARVVVGVFNSAAAAGALVVGVRRLADAGSGEDLDLGAFSATMSAPPAAQTALAHSAAVFAPMPLSSVAPPP
ncbi:MAG: hypothetical protein WKF96_13930, partial [Solirubrobacteraceae bacterium]